MLGGGETVVPGAAGVAEGGAVWEGEAVTANVAVKVGERVGVTVNVALGCKLAVKVALIVRLAVGVKVSVACCNWEGVSPDCGCKAIRLMATAPSHARLTTINHKRFKPKLRSTSPD